jgi:multidrug efflux pump subunit AcrB
VAQVRDGYAVQTNIVRENGTTVRADHHSEKRAGVDAGHCPVGEEAVAHDSGGPAAGLDVKPMFDQSLFVRAAIEGVAREALIAAGLTALMILLFLGSWRSTLIVCTSIPLAILTSCIMLWSMGHTINGMTLGGMALAVGILVDDATVEIENVHRNMGMAKPLTRAILDGAQQIACPRLFPRSRFALCSSPCCC